MSRKLWIMIIIIGIMILGSVILFFNKDGGNQEAKMMNKYGLIDLHLHLDGSLPAKTIIKLAEKDDITLPTTNPDELKSYISVDADCRDLNEYLKCFDIPLSVLQTKESISEATKDLVTKLDRDGLIYAEIRFAPQLHLKRGLTQKEVVEAAVSGMNDATKNCKIKTQLILCCMRSEDNKEENLETVKVAKEFINKGVAAIDLAGAEGLYKTENFEYVFDLAKELNIPFTIHAGEADGADSVRKAIEFGASRIGHGIRANEDPEVLKLLKEKNIPLEMCPTSNLQTKAVNDIKNYPIKDYLSMGLKATVNTDNMIVSGTTVVGEFALLEKELSLTEEEMTTLVKNAVNAAFLSESQKQELMKEVEASLANN